MHMYTVHISKPTLMHYSDQIPILVAVLRTAMPTEQHWKVEHSHVL